MENPEYFIHNNLGHRFVIKPSSIGPHMQFLGNKVSLVTLANHPQSCSFRYSQYVQNAVKNVYGNLAHKGRSLPKRALSPWTINYRPETSIAPELSPILASYYQNLIGTLRCITELGHIYRTIETSTIASMIASPCEGNLNHLYHIFAYLRINHNSSLVLTRR